MSLPRRPAIWLLLLPALLACAAPAPDFFQGYVEGEYVYLAAPMAGRVAEVAVTRGQEVQPGALLFRLEADPEAAAVAAASSRLAEVENRLADLRKGRRPSELAAAQARLKAAQAALALAAAELPRRQALLSRGAISREELDTAQARHAQAQEQVSQLRAELTTAGLGGREDEIRAAEAAVAGQQAALDQARWGLEQKTQSAAAAGVVAEVLHYAGEWVAAGRPVVSLLPAAGRKVRFYVAEPELASLRLGQRVEVRLDGRERPVACRIDHISPRAEYTPPVIYSSRLRADLVFLVEARPEVVDAALLHPGQPVEVRRTDAAHGQP